jgi:hypothetical protein
MSIWSILHIGTVYFVQRKADGRTWRWGPWRSLWAADKCMELLKRNEKRGEL